MQRYSFFAPLWKSWTPGDLYRDLARNRRGAGVAWLLVLSLLIAVAGCVQFAQSLQLFQRDKLPAFVAQVSNISIHNGNVSTPDDQPVLIRDPEGEPGVILFAALPEATEVPAEYASVPVVLLRGQMVVHPTPTDARYFDFKDVKDLTVNRDDVSRWANLYIKFAPWIAFPFFWLFSFVFRLLGWLVYSLSAVMANRIYGAGLRYAALLRITAAAMTPAVVLALLLGIAGIAVPAQLEVLFFVTAVLVGLAVRAVAAGSKPPPTAVPPPLGFQ